MLRGCGLDWLIGTSISPNRKHSQVESIWIHPTLSFGKETSRKHLVCNLRHGGNGLRPRFAAFANKFTLILKGLVDSPAAFICQNSQLRSSPFAVGFVGGRLRLRHNSRSRHAKQSGKEITSVHRLVAFTDLNRGSDFTSEFRAW